MISTTRIVLALLVACAPACFAGDLPFNGVLNNFSKLNGRRVTVVGLAQVEGSDFYLWDLHDQLHKDPMRAITVRWDPRLPNYPPGSNISHYTYLSFRPVRVTGLIDTRFHGRHGDIPFELDLKHIEVLPGPRQRQFLRDLGVFHNSTSAVVRVKLNWRRYTNESTEMEVWPGEYSATGLQDDGLATVTSLSGKRITKCKISLGGATRRFYDSRQHVYYYDVRDSGMRLVMPFEATSWNLRAVMVDRN